MCDITIATPVLLQNVVTFSSTPLFQTQKSTLLSMTVFLWLFSRPPPFFFLQKFNYDVSCYEFGGFILFEFNQPLESIGSCVFPTLRSFQT